MLHVAHHEPCGGNELQNAPSKYQGHTGSYSTVSSTVPQGHACSCTGSIVSLPYQVTDRQTDRGRVLVLPLPELPIPVLNYCRFQSTEKEPVIIVQSVFCLILLTTPFNFKRKKI